mgnify:CR=1 FL=1
MGQRAGGRIVDLQLERLELGGVASAQRTAQVAGVHALEDAGELPVGERHVERELGDVAAAHLRVPRGQIGAIEEARRSRRLLLRSKTW